jgi:hypothetical protein
MSWQIYTRRIPWLLLTISVSLLLADSIFELGTSRYDDKLATALFAFLLGALLASPLEKRFLRWVAEPIEHRLAQDETEPCRSRAACCGTATSCVQKESVQEKLDYIARNPTQKVTYRSAQYKVIQYDSPSETVMLDSGGLLVRVYLSEIDLPIRRIK